MLNIKARVQSKTLAKSSETIGAVYPLIRYQLIAVFGEWV